ncbi:hypothetical protein NDU88_004649 [Pleurodeles waltl]|uniref:Uncharacterized protein n=1 Tax=Pleurodeles waltl TaxID=8319 RepID=A0AAV7MU28_PLEWA|nr:hypothetical protein NDU88_004649 [Pleurodeles waltl]
MEAEVHMTFLCCRMFVKSGMAEPGGAEVRERLCALRERPNMTLSLGACRRNSGMADLGKNAIMGGRGSEAPCVRGWRWRVTPFPHGTPGNVVFRRGCRLLAITVATRVRAVNGSGSAYDVPLLSDVRKVWHGRTRWCRGPGAALRAEGAPKYDAIPRVCRRNSGMADLGKNAIMGGRGSEAPCMRGWRWRVTPFPHGTPGNVVFRRGCRVSTGIGRSPAAYRL